LLEEIREMQKNGKDVSVWWYRFGL
jgi:hypothetical protein